MGAISSILSGFIGMKIATYANARTTLEARKGIAAAFAVGEQYCSSWHAGHPYGRWVEGGSHKGCTESMKDLCAETGLVEE